MNSLLRPCLSLFAAFTVLTGLVFPALITGAAQIVFPHQANGSLIVEDGVVVGSELVGQPFDDPRYFWSRPSAVAYNGGGSSGTNQGPLNPALADAVKARIEALRAADPGNTAPVPVDLVTASGSGLDPHISPAAAAYQVERVARVRGMSVETVRERVEAHTERPILFGEPVVNVLLLNRDLDGKSADVAASP
jgi:K+-transporting ATPase ATPase C chain